MIVSDKNVSDALTYLAEGGAADAEAAHLAAERARERRGAEVFLDAKGSVEERKMRVLVDSEYQVAVGDEIETKVNLSRAKSRERSADKICDIWRTVNANNRKADNFR